MHSFCLRIFYCQEKSISNKLTLAAVSSQLSAADQAVIDAENADRKVVYEAIAQKTGATADLVGKQRAKQLAEQAAAGEYIMDENGTWKKK